MSEPDGSRLRRSEIQHRLPQRLRDAARPMVTCAESDFDRTEISGTPYYLGVRAALLRRIARRGAAACAWFSCGSRQHPREAQPLRRQESFGKEHPMSSRFFYQRVHVRIRSSAQYFQIDITQQCSHRQQRGGYLTVSESVAVLLLVLLSVTPLGAVTVAVSESDPLGAVGGIVPVAV